jgi:HEAT repeat protein
VKLQVVRQAAVVEALGDRGDRAAAPAALALAESNDAAVRRAAVRALARLGDASAVPTLLKAAVQADLAPGAKVALVALPGREADSAILAAAGRGEAQARAVAIEVLGRRRVAAAIALLLGAGDDPNDAVRRAALEALGETAGLPELPRLVELLVKAKTPDDAAVTEKAIAAVCGRAAEKDACAEKLADALPKAGAAKVVIVRLLVQAGGAKALTAVAAAVRDGEEPVRDAAARGLSAWTDVAALDPLLVVARDASNRKYQILALQGLMRLTAQRELPVEKRLALCKEALGLAQRDEEKRLVLGALGKVSRVEALALVEPCLDAPAIREEAATAAVALSAGIVRSHPVEVAAAMNKVLKATANGELRKQAQTLLEATKGK